MNDTEENKIKEMASSLFSMRFSDQNGITNYFLEKFMQQYTAVSFPFFVKALDEVWSKQTSSAMEYSDRFKLTKIFQGVVKVDGHPFYGENTKTQVLHLHKYRGNGYQNILLIKQEERGEFDFLNNTVYHIRTLRDSDTADNIKEFESRMWQPKMNAFTDNGYILTVNEKYKEFRIEGDVMNTFDSYQDVCNILDEANYVLNNPNEF